MKDSRQILLLELGAEGAEIKLILEPNELGIFSYRLDMNENESNLFSKIHVLEIQNKGDQRYWRNSYPLVIDWAGALCLLDNTGWPWPIFIPWFIHPSVSHLVLTALKDRYARYPGIQFEKWEPPSGWGAGEDGFNLEDKKRSAV